jgi:hypothetical protein
VSLALSAGVMIYVSMVEIFVKALSAFSDEWSCPSRLLVLDTPKCQNQTLVDACGPVRLFAMFVAHRLKMIGLACE